MCDNNFNKTALEFLNKSINNLKKNKSINFDLIKALNIKYYNNSILFNEYNGKQIVDSGKKNILKNNLVKLYSKINICTNSNSCKCNTILNGGNRSTYDSPLTSEQQIPSSPSELLPSIQSGSPMLLSHFNEPPPFALPPPIEQHLSENRSIYDSPPPLERQTPSIPSRPSRLLGQLGSPTILFPPLRTNPLSFELSTPTLSSTISTELPVHNNNNHYDSSGNNHYDSSGNNYYDSSGNNHYDSSGNNYYDSSSNNHYNSSGNNYYNSSGNNRIYSNPNNKIFKKIDDLAVLIDNNTKKSIYSIYKFKKEYFNMFQNDDIDIMFENNKDILNDTIKYFESFDNTKCEYQYKLKNFINCSIKIEYINSLGVDAGGLKRDYVSKLSNDIGNFFTIENITGFTFTHGTVDIYTSILEMLYRTNVSIVSSFDIRYILNFVFFDDRCNKELIQTTLYDRDNNNNNNYNSVFLDINNILMNFIHFKYKLDKTQKYIINKDVIEDFDQIEVNEIMNNDGKHFKVILWLFAEYFTKNRPITDNLYQDENGKTIQFGSNEFITYLYTEDIWNMYKFSDNFAEIINNFIINGETNIFNIYNHFYYNKMIDIDRLKQKIIFKSSVLISEELENNILTIFTDYRKILNDNRNKKNENDIDHYLNKYSNQENFLKNLLQFWTGANYFQDIEYKIKGMRDITRFDQPVMLHAHTCFNTFDINVGIANNLSLYDLTIAFLNAMVDESEFNVAG